MWKSKTTLSTEKPPSNYLPYPNQHHIETGRKRTASPLPFYIHLCKIKGSFLNRTNTEPNVYCIQKKPSYIHIHSQIKFMPGYCHCAKLNTSSQKATHTVFIQSGCNETWSSEWQPKILETQAWMPTLPWKHAEAWGHSHSLSLAYLSGLLQGSNREQRKPPQASIGEKHEVNTFHFIFQLHRTEL